MRIAVPSAWPGGLEARVASHFGHCEAFTIVNLGKGNRVAGVEVASNGHQGAGSCATPVNQLVEAGVQALVVGGIGMRPLGMLQAQGIGVYVTRAATVGQAVEAFAKGELPSFQPADACGGSHGPGGCRGHR